MTDQQKNQDKGNLIMGVICLVIILAGVIYNFFLK